MVYGVASLAIHILESGVTLKPKDLESIHGRTEIDMKESGNNASNRAREPIFSKTEILTQVNTKKGSQMERVSTLGKTARFM